MLLDKAAALTRAAHYLARIRSIAHVRALALLGYRGSRDVHVDPGVRVINPGWLQMGDKVHLCRDVKIECNVRETSGNHGEVTIGDHVFVGDRTTIISYAAITIGRLTMIGHNCSIIDANHGTEPGTPMSRQPGRPAAVRIGDDCWLGTGVIVLPGVTIGGGTIVAAGSVVTRSLPEGVMAAGVPARVVRPR
jgi:acetyltransferase-like isoleucine patch superfamily enzyme